MSAFPNVPTYVLARWYSEAIERRHLAAASLYRAELARRFA